MQADRKASPVHFFWGSFDLAVTRFSGRAAPPPKGVTPNVAGWVMAEALFTRSFELRLLGTHLVKAAEMVVDSLIA